MRHRLLRLALLAALAGRAPPDADTDARAHDAWAEALARALPSPCR
jgi:hypothetical protein